jgi:cell division transport system permease protein
LSYVIKLIYFFLEAAVAFWRHKALHGFALFVVTLSLYILGFSQYLTGNVNALLKSWEDNLEVRIFLQDNLPDEEVRALAARLGRDDAVASVEVITPQQGLKVLAKIAPAFGALSEDLGENPLPTALSLRLKSPLNLDHVRRLVKESERLPGVAQVLFDWDWVQRLRTYSRFVALLGWILFGALGVAAVFTVAAITRIIALSRREEIAILHFVGATSASIRGPFIAGGALLGFWAGLFALLLVLSSHLVLHAAAGGDTLLLQWVSRAFLSPRDQALLVTTGTLLGALGGITSLGSLEHWS